MDHPFDKWTAPFDKWTEPFDKWTTLLTNDSRIFFPFLRVNFSRENKFRLRMFVRCGVFFLRSRMFVRCGGIFFSRGSRMFVRCIFFEITNVC